MLGGILDTRPFEGLSLPSGVHFEDHGTFTSPKYEKLETLKKCV